MAEKFKSGDWIVDDGGNLAMIHTIDRRGGYHIIDFDTGGGDDFIEKDALLKRARRPSWVKIAVATRRPVSIRSMFDGHVFNEGEYEFRIFASPNGNHYIINAGCRIFTSFKAARAFWRNHEGRYSNDPGDKLSKTLDQRSLNILDRFEKKLEAYRAGLKPAKKKRARR